MSKPSRRFKFLKCNQPQEDPTTPSKYAERYAYELHLSQLRNGTAKSVDEVWLDGYHMRDKVVDLLKEKLKQCKPYRCINRHKIWSLYKGPLDCYINGNCYHCDQFKEQAHD